MIGDWVLEGLAVGLHLLLVWQISQKLHWSYASRTWRQSWTWFMLAIFAVLLRRFVRLLWPESAAFAFLDLWAPIVNSLCLVLYVHRLSKVLDVDLRLTLPPQAAIIINEFSVILEWSMQSTILFGWTPQEAIGQTLMQTIIPARDWEAHRTGIARMLAVEDIERLPPRALSVIAQRKDGTLVPVDILMTVRRTPEGSWRCHATVRRLIVL